MEKTKLLPYNLQFFAAKDDDNEGAGGTEGNGSNEGTEDNGKASEGNGSDGEEKKFSQSEVSAMMTKEKQEGKKSVFNALGVKDIEEAKTAIDFYNKNKPEEKKPEDENKELKDAKEKAEARATKAENKLACVMAGVNKDSVDDVLSIAMSKVTEEKDLSKVLEEMKNVAKYSGFFGDSKSDKGTGSDVGNIGGNNGGKQSYAKSLAEHSKKSQPKKSYFN